MARDEQRHELIAQLAVRKRRTVLVACLEEQREDVGPVREVRRVAAPGDLREQLPVDLGELAPEAAQPHQGVGPQEAEDEAAAEIGRPRHQPPQTRREPVERRAFVDAEHGAQDHSQRDGVHAGERGRGHPGRPGGDLPAGRLPDEILVGAHPLAMERWQDELAATQVLVSVEQQQVLRAQQRTQGHVRHARVHLVGSVSVQLANRVRMGEHDPCLCHHPQREHVPERAVSRFEEPVWVQAEAQCLHRSR